MPDTVLGNTRLCKKTRSRRRRCDFPEFTLQILSSYDKQAKSRDPEHAAFPHIKVSYYGSLPQILFRYDRRDIHKRFLYASLYQRVGAPRQKGIDLGRSKFMNDIDDFSKK